MDHPQRKALAVLYNKSYGTILSTVLKKFGFETEVLISQVPIIEEVRGKLKQAIDLVVTDWTRVDGEAVMQEAKAAEVDHVILLDGGMPEAEPTAQALGVEVFKKGDGTDKFLALVNRLLSKEKVS